MSKQPEALRLANLLDEECVVNWIHATGGAPRAYGTKPHKLSVDAAAELRRLHAANAELVEALNALYVAAPVTLSCKDFHHSRQEQHTHTQECKPAADYLAALAGASAALSKHKEQA